ncbi:MAG: NAD(P)/FAD-dependent oxidoreductase [Sandaracinus sp.]|nr:NAD(P)/FAD-dependent oxidoreductase [Sandaracinus sp.]MCB9619703.1 NAD(P)/FAD-dependent oxidoreductase [Sandaracinus sp.]MCB9624046.1 NAD(P)/FAD-dependent oxidoreductase [Sandaracinus sp.]
MTIERFGTAIVGTGFSGLGMAMRLADAGDRDFVIFEKASSVGGTWRENHYPGCACDVPSHLYSFSFAPNPRWSRAYSPHHEIREYLERCAQEWKLDSHLRFECPVTRAVFDETRGVWRLSTPRGEVEARDLVFGVGALSRPALPSFEGMETFEGPSFHSAAWDHAVSLAGKRVAVVGTGASAIQIVPEVAKEVAHLDVFQRTAPWVLPKPDRAYTEAEKRRFERSRWRRQAHRARIYASAELAAVGMTLEPRVMAVAETLGRRHIQRQIRDTSLRAKVTPTFKAGCKRILLSNDYYRALARPHVDVVTDGIARIEPWGIRTRSGELREVDVIAYATGFAVADFLTPVEVVGRRGVRLAEAWADGIESHLGTTVNGFPNLYLLMGPNTGLGHNSMVFMIEAQIHHVLGLRAARDRKNAATVEPRPSAQHAFNVGIQKRLERTVWASGCASWYLDEHGKNRTLWPGFTFEYWWRTRRVDEEAMAFEPTRRTHADLRGEVRMTGAAKSPVERTT